MSEGPESDPAEVADELNLVDEDEETLEPDDSDEATAEADMSDTGPDPDDGGHVEVEDVDGEMDAAAAAPGAAVGGTALLLRVTRRLRREGLVVKATAGWQTRTRSGTFAPRGVMFHHTASRPQDGPAASLGTVVNGRRDLAGPLCELLVARDRTVYLIAGGRANHAGKGGPWRNVPRNSGNAYILGVEVENDGTHEPWAQELLRACEVVFASVLLELRRGPAWLVAHREWAPHRKKDPSRIDMNRFRGRVARAMRDLG
jgi:hypothetical protein